jgi:hypothetical protein
VWVKRACPRVETVQPGLRTRRFDEGLQPRLLSVAVAEPNNHPIDLIIGRLA